MDRLGGVVLQPQQGMYDQVVWGDISGDKWVLDTVSAGLAIPLPELPAQGPETYPFSKLQGYQADLILKDFLAKGFIQQAIPCTGQFISPYFLVDKASGEPRFILDLSWLNKNIPDLPFKLESLDNVQSLLEQGAWMAKLDLQDAYYSVRIRSQDRKLLRFWWGGVLMEFLVMPNGLKCAPYVFTMVLKPIVGYLRSLGLRLIIYLDDLWVTSKDQALLQEQMHLAVATFQRLGFQINRKKSVLIPGQELEFLGFIIHSPSLTYRFRQEKLDQILSLCRDLYQQEEVVIRDLARLLGLLQAADRALVVARLHYRSLQCHQIRAIYQLMQEPSRLPMHVNLKHCYSMSCRLPEVARKELKWWLDNLLLLPPGKIREQECDLELFSDACLTGWGAECGGEGIQGKWGPPQQGLDINHLEFLAVTKALDYFTTRLKGVRVKVRVDNETVKWYVKKMGGTKSWSLVELALAFWELALSRDLQIEVEYISTKENLAADLYSRVTMDPRLVWSLNEQVFRNLALRWGQPSIDLFASAGNKKVPRYLSWLRDELAVGQDAFSHNWGREDLPYAFPNFNAIARVLDYLRKFPETVLILIAPVWRTRPWYPMILELLVDVPLLSESEPGGDSGSEPGTPPPESVREAPTCGMEAFLQTCRSEGFSEPACQLMASRWAPGTQRTYNSAWKVWLGWCAGRDCCPLSPSLRRIVSQERHK